MSKIIIIIKLLSVLYFCMSSCAKEKKKAEHLGNICFGRQAVLLSNTLRLACPLSASLSLRSFPATVIGCRSLVTLQSHSSLIN